MIEVNDVTLIEANGNREKVAELMGKEVPGEWMLKTTAFVTTEIVSSSYILHFWKNGKVIIFDVDNTQRIEPSDDLRELSTWVKANGWLELGVHDRLLQNRATLDYWNKAFISGLVTSEVLYEQEQAEFKRLSKYQNIEREEENTYGT